MAVLTAARAAPPSRRRRRWKVPAVPLGIALVFLLGVLVLGYPSASSWLAHYRQSQQILGYTHVVDTVGPEGRAEVLAAAHRYNESLTGGAVVDSYARLPVAAPGDTALDYAELLTADDRGLMARLRIPTIDVDLPVFHGTSERVLLEGIGHLQGTSLPVGGPSTHAVLTGHRGLAEATMLTHLDEVAVGDGFTLETFGEVLTYEVVDVAVVEPHETQTLYPAPGADLVTLVTCTPIGVNSHRILVTGERVTPTPVEDLAVAGEQPAGAPFPWWAAAVVVTVLVLARYVWRAGRRAAAGPPPVQVRGRDPAPPGVRPAAETRPAGSPAGGV